ncbi:hypothetical protein Q3G72_000722 [Acer saccharum]|nr:hypothetical protein Q3G72_000722 [Acer saccharum]
MHSLQQHSPSPLHLTLLKTSKTHQDTTQLHAFAVKTNLIQHTSLSSRLVSLYADPEINNLRYARSVFDQIQDPSLVLHNLVIKCYVFNQQSHEAIALFRDLLGKSLLPDNFTLPCVIKGCARLNAVEEGKQIHGLVLKLGFGLDKFVSSSFVSLYAKCGEMGMARKAFDVMDENDLVSWNSLIDGFTDAFELFENMLDGDVVPNDATLVSVLSAISGLASLSKGRWVHSYMVKNGFLVHGVLGTLLIQMYSRGKEHYRKYARETKHGDSDEFT